MNKYALYHIVLKLVNSFLCKMKNFLLSTIIFLVCKICLAQFSYIVPVYETKIFNYGLTFDKPTFEVNGFTMTETKLSKSDELKIRLPNPNLTYKNNQCLLQMGFAVYDYKDSLLGLAPDLFGGKPLDVEPDMPLDKLTYTFKFKGVKEDSSFIKLKLFGIDKYSGDSFVVFQNLTILEDKQVDNNKGMNYVFTKSLNKTEELLLGFNLKIKEYEFKLNDNKPLVLIELEDSINLQTSKIIAYNELGEPIWQSNKISSQYKDNTLFIYIPISFPKNAKFIHWETEAVENSIVKLGGFKKL